MSSTSAEPVSSPNGAPKPASIGNLLVNILAAPSQALDALRTHPRAWFPLVLLAAAWIGLWYWYFSAVDYPWLIDHMIATETANAAPDQKEAIGQGIAKLKPGALVILSSLLVIVVLILVTVLTSAYLVVVSAIVDDDYRFRHWFSLSLWGSIPSLFSILAMVVNFMLAPGGRIAPENLNPLSFNNLVGLPPGNSFATLLDSIDLTSLWTWGLLTYGYRQWTGSGWARSLLIVMVPIVAIYGTWAVLVWL